MRHEREFTLERRARGPPARTGRRAGRGAGGRRQADRGGRNRSREAETTGREHDQRAHRGVAVELKTDPELSLQLALQAVDLGSDAGGTVPADTTDALHWAFQASGIQYPAVDGPVSALPGPLGYRGIFDVPVSELANIALQHVGRQVNANTCERFFGTSECPALPTRFSSNVESAASTTALLRTPLAGTSVTVEGVDDAGLARELRAFGEKRSIDIQMAHFNNLFKDLQEDPPDIAFISQPPWFPELASKGLLMDVGAYLDAGQLRRDYGRYLLSLATVAPDGSWPADAGTLYGVPAHLGLKSLIWYPVPEFRRAGYRVPTTWRQLVALTNQMIGDGRTPWCMGLESATTDGWPATDWIEDLLLSGSARGTHR